MCAFRPQNQSLSQRVYSSGMPFIDYYRRGRLIGTANYASMRDAKPSLRPSFERHHNADGTDRAVLLDDEGNVRRVLPKRG